MPLFLEKIRVAIRWTLSLLTDVSQQTFVGENVMSMFSMFNMMGNVARFEKGDLIVDTCRVTDSQLPTNKFVGLPAPSG
jgi:hypothetical protein